MANYGRFLNKVLHGAIGVCLMCMASFVFLNVIMRYFFNSGLTWAEEASRYLFIWLIFLGAVVAQQENVHLGMDTLVTRLSAKNKRYLFIFNNLLIVATMALVVDGTYKLTLLTMDQVSASMRLPLAFVYASGLVCSLAMVIICLHNAYLLIRNKVAEKDLVMTADSEDKLFIDQVVGEPTEKEVKKP